ncbi:ferric reductase-like transmembrane domain-containing protein [Nakamurella panacisegetis]|nr:ferric reductase-like transmembrane domain-containing protein [Nakamurella panacisegetis]
MNTQTLWYASRATGAVSLVLFTAVILLGISTARRHNRPAFPRSATLRLHRSVSVTAVVFLTVHIVTAIADGYVKLNYWDVFLPFTAAWDPLWVGLGSVAVDLLLAVLVSSAVRRRLTVRTWRLVHLASYAMWPIALVHGFGIAGGDGRSTWMLALDVVCIAAVAGMLLVRLRPDRHPDTLQRSVADVVHPRTPPGANR